LNESSYHLFNAETFRKCQPGSIIINTSRGGLIDTRALRDALESGHLAGAGLDVLEDERLFQTDANRLVAEEIIAHLHATTRVSPEELHLRNPERLAEIQELGANEALLARPDVIFTPHIAFNSIEAVRRIDEVTVANIRAFSAGQPINIVVD
jgi:D-lactate dehydrogenase